MTLLVGSIFHMTRKIVSEMTYNVSMGTLNPTIPYHLLSALDLGIVFLLRQIAATILVMSLIVSPILTLRTKTYHWRRFELYECFLVWWTIGYKLIKSMRFVREVCCCVVFTECWPNGFSLNRSRARGRFPLSEFTGRVDGPRTRVHFLTPVNSGRQLG